MFVRLSQTLSKRVLHASSKDCVSIGSPSVVSGKRHKYKGPNAVPSTLMQGSHHNTALFANGDFKSRDSDVWIVCAMKSGSTMTQQIVRELLYGANNKLTTAPMTEVSPWPAMTYTLLPNRLSRHLEAQSHRRMFKCHEPIEALPFNAKNKHIVLVRDFRDVIWSMFDHTASYKWWVRWLHNAPTHFPKVRFPKLAADYGAKDFWDEMTHSGDQFGNPDGAWMWSPLWVTGSWMHALRTDPSLTDSILFVHYMDLCRDPLAEIKRIADFIGVEASGERLLEIKDNTSLESMRKMKGSIGLIRHFFKEGNASFFRKGGSRRGHWQSQLGASDLDRYRQLADYYMHPDDVCFMEDK